MVLLLLLFAPTNTFAQTDFIYSTDGKIENFKIRKDIVLLQCQPNTQIKTLVNEFYLTSAFNYSDNLIIATIDTLKTNINSLKRAHNVADVTYALEYADSNIQIPTYEIFVEMKDGKTPEEILNITIVR